MPMPNWISRAKEMCNRLNAKHERHGALAHFIAATFIYHSGEVSLDELARALPARMAFVATRVAKSHLALLHNKGINPQNVADYVSRALPQLESLLSDEFADWNYEDLGK